jgi:DNA-binding MarR family transcriptional regulator
MTTPPAVYGQFGQALAFSERTMSAVLHDHLAQQGIEPGTWYALKLITTRGPGLSRQDLRRDLEESQNVATASVAGLLSRLEAEGLIHGDTSVDLTAQGEARYESLREYVGGPTVRLLSQFDLGDIETTVRTLQAITRRAADESAASAGQPG